MFCHYKRRLVQQQEGQQGAAETLLKALATPNPIFQVCGVLCGWFVRAFNF